MENSKINEQIVIANISKLKLISLISLGFSIFALFTDFFVQGIWRAEVVYFYKILDISFAIISVSAVFFFWFFKIKNIDQLKAGILVFPFLFLIWSAVITGIDFTTLGISTFIIVVLLTIFFLYLNLITSIIFLVSSGLAFISTLYLLGDKSDFLSALFILIPTICISVLISARNYKNKVTELFNQGKMEEMNNKLIDSNENLEREVDKRTKEILIALEKAEESDHLKSAFLANMSHEIRTPMNGILGFAELLKEPNLSGEEQQDYIKIIEKSGTRMLNIINDIVNISKIEAGLMEIHLKESNINEQIEYIYTFFKPEVEARGIKFSFKNSLSAKEAIIYTDREKVFAILTNLVKNAIKFTKEGSIEFGYNRVETRLIASLQFYVKDTGKGIPDEKKEIIFERFMQSGQSYDINREGTGLGLSISKAYVEILGGKIWVESVEGVGSTFYFTLPYAAEPEEITIPQKDLPFDKANNQVSDLKILIAEDDEISEILITMMVKMFSKEILTARTGHETIEICHNNPDIDLILMDILMSELDGYEATRQIRQFNKEVIIIAQTAYGLTGDREKAIEAGCNDYISKPIKKDELLLLIEKYFMKKE